MPPDGLAELDRLKQDGHHIRKRDKNHTLTSTLESCRATQLYRTFLHELGHWVDFLEKVERPAAMLASMSEQYPELLDRFHRRPDREKEQFAHAYAESVRRDFVARQIIPFERKVDHAILRQEKLLVEDFEFSEQ
jgi:hypothetical protein